MLAPFCPQFSFDPSSGALALSLPIPPWESRIGGVGGSAVSASGLPASFVVRTDYLRAITLRVPEEDLADVLDFLAQVRDGSLPFYFWFDQELSDTEHYVYLSKPLWPEDLMPQRSADEPGTFELDIEIRTVDGTDFTTVWVEVDES